MPAENVCFYMIALRPQILESNGKRQFAVLPYEEFVALQQFLADVQDLLDLREAKSVEGDAATMSLEAVKTLLNR